MSVCIYLCAVSANEWMNEWKVKRIDAGEKGSHLFFGTYKTQQKTTTKPKLKMVSLVWIRWKWRVAFSKRKHTTTYWNGISWVAPPVYKTIDRMQQIITTIVNRTVEFTEIIQTSQHREEAEERKWSDVEWFGRKLFIHRHTHNHRFALMMPLTMHSKYNKIGRSDRRLLLLLFA